MRCALRAGVIERDAEAGDIDIGQRWQTRRTRDGGRIWGRYLVILIATLVRSSVGGSFGVIFPFLLFVFVIL